MNCSYIFLFALALFGVVAQAYIATGGVGYGAVGALGYNGICAGGYGAGFGPGYGAGYEAGYGCRTACNSAAVCDNCQCVKTIVRPNMVERIPYNCARRVQSSSCRSSCGLYPNVYGAGVGTVGNGCSGYLNGGYVY